MLTKNRQTGTTLALQTNDFAKLRFAGTVKHGSDTPQCHFSSLHRNESRNPPPPVTNIGSACSITASLTESFVFGEMW